MMASVNQTLPEPLPLIDRSQLKIYKICGSGKYPYIHPKDCRNNCKGGGRVFKSQAFEESMELQVKWNG